SEARARRLAVGRGRGDRGQRLLGLSVRARLEPDLGRLERGARLLERGRLLRRVLELVIAASRLAVLARLLVELRRAREVARARAERREVRRVAVLLGAADRVGEEVMRQEEVGRAVVDPRLLEGTRRVRAPALGELGLGAPARGVHLIARLLPDGRDLHEVALAVIEPRGVGGAPRALVELGRLRELAPEL